MAGWGVIANRGRNRGGSWGVAGLINRVATSVIAPAIRLGPVAGVMAATRWRAAGQTGATGAVAALGITTGTVAVATMAAGEDLAGSCLIGG